MCSALSMFHTFSDTTKSFENDLQGLIVPSAHAAIMGMLHAQSEAPLSSKVHHLDSDSNTTLALMIHCCGVVHA
jgi:hypothetical protein